jgi:nucleoside-diphosphate-sugar epimerase
MNDVLKIIERMPGVRSRSARGAQKGDMRDTYADTSLAREGPRVRPKVSLEEGIQAEYRWLASSPALVSNDEDLQI